MRQGWSARLLLVLAFTGLACAPTWTAPRELPSFTVDLEASELRMRAEGGRLDEGAAIRVREWVEEDLRESLSRRGDSGGPPARFQADVVAAASPWPTFACLFVLILVGCPSVETTMDVRLTLDTGTERLEGRGTGSNVASLYYNMDGRQSLRRAVRAAVLDAIERRKKGGS